MHRISVVLAALGFAWAAGCANNTICTPGTFVCTGAQGQGEGQVLSECQGPSGGGDKDGEFVPVTDCGKKGQICMTGIYTTKSGDTEFGVCEPSQCGHFPCPEAGLRQCSLTAIEECGTDTNGCPSWSFVKDCANTSQACKFDSSGAPYCG